jgi:hypothetical protein
MDLKPIEREDQEEFARSIIEIARTFGITSVSLTYRDSSRSGEHAVSWAEGRHGSANEISLSYRAMHSISERPMP